MIIITFSIFIIDRHIRRVSQRHTRETTYCKVWTVTCRIHLRCRTYVHARVHTNLQPVCYVSHNVSLTAQTFIVIAHYNTFLRIVISRHIIFHFFRSTTYGYSLVLCKPILKNSICPVRVYSRHQVKCLITISRISDECLIHSSQFSCYICSVCITNRHILEVYILLCIHHINELRPVGETDRSIIRYFCFSAASLLGSNQHDPVCRTWTIQSCCRRILQHVNRKNISRINVSQRIGITQSSAQITRLNRHSIHYVQRRSTRSNRVYTTNMYHRSLTYSSWRSRYIQTRGTSLHHLVQACIRHVL